MYVISNIFQLHNEQSLVLPLTTQIIHIFLVHSDV